MGQADTRSVVDRLSTVLRGRTDSRVRASVRVVVPIALWFASYVALSSLLETVPTVGRLPGQVVTTATYLLSLGVVLLVSSRWLDHRPIRAYGFPPDGRWWLDLAGALGIGVLTQGLLDAVYLALGWAHVSAVASPGAGDSFVIGVALTLLLMVGIGVWEETMLRGVVLLNAVEGLGRRLDSPVGAVLGAWLFSSAVFGGLHLLSAENFEETALAVVLLSTTISGLYFGLAYVLTGSLAFPIGLHVSTNFAGVSLFGIAAPPGDGFATAIRLEREFSGIWVPLGGLELVYVTALLLAVVGWVYLTRGRVSIDDSLLEAASRQRDR
jgi:membrane protease YdiL (CAAX protease family)